MQQLKPPTPNSHNVVTEDKYCVYFKIFKVEGESASETKPTFHGWGQETIAIPTCIARLKRDGTCAETIFGLSAKRTSPFKSAEASFQSTAGSRGVRTRGSNAGYTVF